MKVGISVTSAHNVDDVRAGARTMVERAAAAANAELDSLFVGDHHVTPTPYYQNTAILGRMLAEWGDAPAGVLYLLPMWNPVLLAEQVATLASIASGRFIMQCGLGRGEAEFSAFGLNIRQRPSLFEQSLDIIRRLLTGETVSSDGRYQIERAHISPLPPEPVEVWVGGSVDAAIDRAARLGDAWLAAPDLSMEEARHRSTYYRERNAAHGREPVAVAIRRDVYVGESEQEAEKTAGPIADNYRGFDREALVLGSVDQVAVRFRELAEQGYTDVITRSMVADQRQALASIARLGEVRRAVADA